MKSINFTKTLFGCTLFFTFAGCSENSQSNSESENTNISKKEIVKKAPQQKKPPVIPVSVKKQKFRKLLVPAVEKVYSELDAQYDEIKTLVEEGKDDPRINSLMKKYSAKDTQQLLRRLKPHPKSIAIAQAAMESAWATSRFTKVANNLFGVWSFSKNEPRVAAGEKRGDKTIYVKKYDSMSDSIRDYYMVLSKGQAYREFRELNMKTDDPFKLVKKLDNYSEKGAEYGKELASMIRFNKFYKLDGFKEGELKYTTVAIEKKADVKITKDINTTDLNGIDINSADLNSTDLYTTDTNNSN